MFGFSKGAGFGTAGATRAVYSDEDKDQRARTIAKAVRCRVAWLKALRAVAHAMEAHLPTTAEGRKALMALARGAPCPKPPALQWLLRCQTFLDKRRVPPQRPANKWVARGVPDHFDAVAASLLVSLQGPPQNSAFLLSCKAPAVKDAWEQAVGGFLSHCCVAKALGGNVTDRAPYAVVVLRSLFAPPETHWGCVAIPATASPQVSQVLGAAQRVGGEAQARWAGRLFVEGGRFAAFAASFGKLSSGRCEELVRVAVLAVNVLKAPGAAAFAASILCSPLPSGSAVWDGASAATVALLCQALTAHFNQDKKKALSGASVHALGNLAAAGLARWSERLAVERKEAIFADSNFVIWRDCINELLSVVDGTTMAHLSQSQSLDNIATLWCHDAVIIFLHDVFASANAVDAAPQPSEGVEAKKKKKKGFFAQIRDRAKKDKKEAVSAANPFAASAANPFASGDAAAATLTFNSMKAHFAVPTWLPIVRFYLACVCRGQLYAPLTSASFINHLLEALWARVQRDAPFYQLYLEQAAASRGATAHLPSAVRLSRPMLDYVQVQYSFFCHVYAHFLLVCDDDEFMKLQVPFTTATVHSIVNLTNRMLYATVTSPQSAADEGIGFKASMKQLLRHLLDRSLRTGFDGGDPKYWLVGGSYDANLLNPQVSSGLGLRILSEMPHVVPFNVRVEFLQNFIKADRRRHALDKVKYAIRVRRTHCLVDGYEQLMHKLPADTEGATLLRARLHVQFVDQHGMEEAGIDAGGVFKEFMEQLVVQAFHPNYGLFCVTPERNQLYPNPQAASVFGSMGECLEAFRFLGRVLGKAMYESIVVNLQFAPFFLNTVLGRTNGLDDLKLLDPQEHRSLLQLKDMEDVSDAYLFFSVEEDHFGRNETVDLIPNGRDVQVTNDNVCKFLHMVAHHKLYRSTKAYTQAFIAGLFDVLERPWVLMYNATELQQLISCGVGGGFVVSELRATTKLVGGYKEDSRTLELLWEVLEEMTDEEKGKFLLFCTGSSRAPLLGFAAMNPPFSIRKTEEKSSLASYVVDIDRLPTASTCFNLLKLPPYKSKKNLRTKLLCAITSNSGFDLS